MAKMRCNFATWMGITERIIGVQFERYRGLWWKLCFAKWNLRNKKKLQQTLLQTYREGEISAVLGGISVRLALSKVEN